MGFANYRNVGSYIFGAGALAELAGLVQARRDAVGGRSLYVIDAFFKGKALVNRLPLFEEDVVLYIDTSQEPSTVGIDNYYQETEKYAEEINAVVAIGGGSTLDTGKALANLMTNDGKAEAYQGWDLVEKPALYKIGIPTIPGTGAESSRTCVMINPKNGLKLGMNSNFSVFDQLILDPELSCTVPREQYFHTGMDAYIHSIESLGGSYRNDVSDALSRETVKLCRDVFLHEDMMSLASRSKLAVASYLGGVAIAGSFVGVIHPFSAGLSTVLHIRHGLANCIALEALGEFYPEETREFGEMKQRQQIEIPKGVCRDLSEAQYLALYDATVVHEKPLTNALGEGFKSILTRDKVIELFKTM